MRCIRQPHDTSGNAHDGGASGHVRDHDRVCANVRARADNDAAQHPCARANGDIVANTGIFMAIAHPHGDGVDDMTARADLRRHDDSTRGMGDVEPRPYANARCNIQSITAQIRAEEHPRHQRQTSLVCGITQPIAYCRSHAREAQVEAERFAQRQGRQRPPLA